MRYCLSLGADTSLRDRDGLGCLHATIGTADIEGNTPEISVILKLLLEHRVDPSVPSSNRGFTPLHHAADTRNYDAVKVLLEQDIDINATDKAGKTALWYACLHPSPNLEMIKKLAVNGCYFVDHQTPDLPVGHRETIFSILKKNMVSPNGR